ncbi:MAG: hypothetical protein LAO09_15810, partial [Acidobacteriia bacterium]|nr:hypothetical protein [Terriglobia bacterium]
GVDDLRPLDLVPQEVDADRARRHEAVARREPELAEVPCLTLPFLYRSLCSSGAQPASVGC